MRYFVIFLTRSHRKHTRPPNSTEGPVYFSLVLVTVSRASEDSKRLLCERNDSGALTVIVLPAALTALDAH